MPVCGVAMYEEHSLLAIDSSSQLAMATFANPRATASAPHSPSLIGSGLYADKI